jgi:signal transduction histidine kinase
LRRDLAAVVTVALARQEHVEGGIWQADAASLAYAFPTYPGGPKTDLPAAEESRIRAINEQAAREEQSVAAAWASRTQTLLLQACPLAGLIPGLTAWTMTRVQAAPGFERLRLGLGVLLALVLGSSGWLTWLLAIWARHIAAIEAALAHDNDGPGTIPALPRTGERELDRIVSALNSAGQRLAASRRRAEELAVRVAAAERLAALGRVAAGVAHEIRNPIAAMRLRAENALAGDDTRRRVALADMLGQIARLDGLISELLAMTQRREARPVRVALGPFLDACVERHRDEAARRSVTLATECRVEQGCLDPEIVGRILDNLLLNALRHVSEGSGRVEIVAAQIEGQLRLVVSDTGPGVSPKLREHLFEPFVTGRADGTGLGLAIARELADGHRGRLFLLRAGGEGSVEGAAFALDLPQETACPPF